MAPVGQATETAHHLDGGKEEAGPHRQRDLLGS